MTLWKTFLESSFPSVPTRVCKNSLWNTFLRIHKSSRIYQTIFSAVMLYDTVLYRTQLYIVSFMNNSEKKTDKIQLIKKDSDILNLIKRGNAQNTYSYPEYCLLLHWISPLLVSEFLLNKSLDSVGRTPSQQCHWTALGLPAHTASLHGCNLCASLSL